MKKLCILFLFVLLAFNFSASASNDTIIFNNDKVIISIGKQIQILNDKSNSLTFEQVLNSKDFNPITENVPNLGITKNTHWIKFAIKNELKNRRILLQLQYTIIDQIEFYAPTENNQ